ncbi:MAG: CDP-glycerol glycerophosphotransferase family protein [Bacilli bacterium]
MKFVLILAFKYFLKIIYFFLKLLPIDKKQIVFISRQTNEISIDFAMIRDEIQKRDSSIKMKFICQRIDKGLLSYIKYFFIIIKQMKYLATSKMAIIDSYCIPVCILNHKKSLIVLQIWHSIGKIKKSGYQTLDAVSGRNSKIAKLMCMHKNYTNIIAGGSAFDEFYEAGFNVRKDVLLHYGLPRIDYLLNNENKFKEEVLNKYPEFKNKKIVYYVPTFRKYNVDGPTKMFKEYNKDDFILIVRGHPNQPLEFNHDVIYDCPEFKNIELLTVADYVITDYSSICLEAAILNKKVLFYVYDYDKYMSENGINLDATKVLPTCTSKDIKDLFKIIKNDAYDNISYQKFRKKYLPKNLGNSTKLIVDYIMKNISN